MCVLACPRLISHEPWLDIMKSVMIRIGMIEPQNVNNIMKPEESV